ncbi:MAG: primosomal protein N' [Clostridia bacterium]
MIYEVIVDISSSNVDKVFDYYGEDFFCVGQRVLVPFANKQIEGFIVGKKEHTDVPDNKLKSLLLPLDEYVALSPEMLSLASYLQYKYHLRLIDALRLFIPSQMRGGKVKEVFSKTASISTNYTSQQILIELGKKAKKQVELINYLVEVGSQDTITLNKMFGVALNALTKKGYIDISFTPRQRTPYKSLSQTKQAHILTTDQQNAYDTIMSNLSDPYLLFGVTGSGKTEVYLRVIEQVIASGKTAIMLVPEISLTPNMLRLFRSRFGENVAILHSGLSVGERFDEWQRLKRGQARIAVGARSAIFAPLQNLGVIIIDEQHDSSYISQSNPRYDTQVVAEFRAKYNNCCLVLGSATPSLDTFYYATKGKYKLINMPSRINERPLPKVELVDMSLEMRMGNNALFSVTLKNELDECLAKGNQAMLFVNRRGYSSFLMCPKCGYVAKCKDCDVALTYHKEDNQLKCHYCKNRYKVLDVCPVCKNNKLRQGRMGTEQVVAYLKTLYPEVEVLRMDFDTTQTKESHVRILDAFSLRKAQILVGTQMIAKGHDFPYVTLVGILDGDQSLYHSDYLSSEKTYQLLTQVSGRSGRDKQVGKVVLQTYTPKHYCLQLAKDQDYLAFYKKEINLREATNFPPFTEVIRILYTSPTSQKCVDLLNKHYAVIENIKESYPNDFLFLQRMRCPLQRIENKHRYQILIKLSADSADQILQQIYQATDIQDKEVSVFCERNPQNLS